jgi:TIR domain-containing protein
MDLFENPPFSIAIVWHPDFTEGAGIAAHLHEHFRGDTFRGAAREGIQVSHHSQPAFGAQVPPPLPIVPERCQAVVLLVEESLQKALDDGWRDYLDGILDAVEATCGASLIYPVAFDKTAFSVLPRLGATNFIRWYDWPENPLRRLTAVLTHELSRLLLPWVQAIEGGHPLPPAIDDEEPPEPITVFISHSKLDGEEIAVAVRDAIHQSSLKSFFDVYDIPPGRSFAKVIQGKIRKSALLVIQTDSFASREWCRLEVLTARRFEVPVVALSALREGEARAFPYGGNVPVVMGGALDESRITLALARLLDENLKDLFWRLQRETLVGMARKLDPEPVLLRRAPDLLALVGLDPKPKLIIHPDPPLGNAEMDVLRALVKDLRLETPTSLYVAPEAA